MGSRRVRQDRVRSQQQQSRLRGPDGVPGVWGLTPGAGTGRFFQSENSLSFVSGNFSQIVSLIISSLSPDVPPPTFEYSIS